jgi:hypothetical protein
MGPLGFALIAVGIVLLAVNASITSIVALHWLGVALIVLGGVACVGAVIAWMVERMQPPPPGPPTLV